MVAVEKDTLRARSTGTGNWAGFSGSEVGKGLAGRAGSS